MAHGVPRPPRPGRLTLTQPFGPENTGYATIEPRGAVIAASHGTWTLRYTAGAYGIDDGGHVRIAQRQVSDWEPPQFDRPDESGYLTARSNARVTLELQFFHNIHPRPFRRALQVNVFDGALAPGDWVEVVYGDTSRGGPGIRAQTFAESRSEFRVFVDPFGANSYLPLRDHPWLEVVGGAASRLEVIAPSDAEAGRPFRFGVRAVDAWGNTDPTFAAEISLAADTDVDGLPARLTFSPADRGVIAVEGVAPRRRGDLTVTAACAGPRLQALSNIVRCHASRPPWTLYWGDLHGQSMETVGVNSAREYFHFARDAARLDFAGHQGNDFQITTAFWAELTKLVREFHVPGRFVTFLGYEWSGNTANGGDRNVHFLGDRGALHRSSHALVDDLSDAGSDRCPLDRLYATFAGRDDVMLVPHVGGRRANFEFFDPSLEFAVEVHSSHGTFEWFGLDAVRRGHKVGFLCGSDVHTGKPGASRPSAGVGMEAFGVRGGIAGVYAEDLTRESLWKAIKARRCYGTTGERIAIWFECNGQPMGGELPAGPDLAFAASVKGASPLQSVEILRSGGQVYEIRPRSAGRRSRRLRISWTGADGRGRRRGTSWNGSLRLTGAVIAAVETVGFDHPNERVISSDASSVRWASSTAGDLDGVEIELEDFARAALRFESGPATFEVSLDEIGGRPWRYEAGAVARWVELEWVAPELDSRTVEFKHTIAARDAEPGAYYLRVIQKDCEMAWTSPIYIGP